MVEKMANHECLHRRMCYKEMAGEKMFLTESELGSTSVGNVPLIVYTVLSLI